MLSTGDSPDHTGLLSQRVCWTVNGTSGSLATIAGYISSARWTLRHLAGAASSEIEDKVIPTYRSVGLPIFQHPLLFGTLDLAKIVYARVPRSRAWFPQ